MSHRANYKIIYGYFLLEAPRPVMFTIFSMAQ